MKLLLDTHAFLFWDSEPFRLGARASDALQDPANVLLLSVASVWEMQIKSQLGKLRLVLSLAQIVENQRKTNNLLVLPVLLEHVLALEQLPQVHRDPFDRLLIAQSLAEGATLISQDHRFGEYNVPLLW
jgi:PIN domain nuclease of toxin-antitoxin system